MVVVVMMMVVVVVLVCDGAFFISFLFLTSHS